MTEEMVMKALRLALACMSLTAPATAATIVDRPMVREAAAEVSVTKFLNALQAGKIDGLVEDLFATSPLWRGKTVELQAMKAQVNGAVQAYGPVQGYELIESDRLGTSVIRQYYLVRHEKMVTRWEFEIARTGGGWAVVYFGFEDQVKTWF